MPSPYKEREELSIDVKHESVRRNERKNGGRSNMWSVMLSCTIVQKKEIETVDNGENKNHTVSTVQGELK